MVYDLKITENNEVQMSRANMFDIHRLYSPWREGRYVFCVRTYGENAQEAYISVIEMLDRRKKWPREYVRHYGAYEQLLEDVLGKIWERMYGDKIE